MSFFYNFNFYYPDTIPETGLSISTDHNYKFLMLIPLEADEKYRGTQALLWNYPREN
jgi:hypothetical protein